MKALLTAIFVSALFTGSFSQASARYEVDCSFHDCASSGWEMWDWLHTFRQYTTCKAGGCFTTGYIVEDERGMLMDVTCNAGGCWSAGWNTVIYPRGAGAVSYESTQCYNSNCLADGWWTTSNTGGIRQIQCYNHDCGHFGWTTNGPSAGSNTMCKLSDCFENGWTVDVY